MKEYLATRYVFNQKLDPVYSYHNTFLPYMPYSYQVLNKNSPNFHIKTTNHGYLYVFTISVEEEPPPPPLLSPTTLDQHNGMVV